MHLPLTGVDVIAGGENRVDVAVTGSARNPRLTDVEVRYDYHHHLEPLWRREATPLNREGSGTKE